jgi:hypothetical protein
VQTKFVSAVVGRDGQRSQDQRLEGECPPEFLYKQRISFGEYVLRENFVGNVWIQVRLRDQVYGNSREFPQGFFPLLT